jgi:hypothetical protein
MPGRENVEQGKCKGNNSVIEHTVVTARNYAYITIKGSPDLDAFIRASRIFKSDPGYSIKLHRICDFSQADLSHVSMDMFLRYVEFAVRELGLAPETKIALVAPDRDRMGIFEQFASNVKSGVVQLFTDPMDAVEWIQT